MAIERGDDDARAEIEALCARADLDPLVMLWARAARIQLARDLGELAVASRSASSAAEARPLALRALSLAAEDADARLAKSEVLLRAVQLDPEQRRELDRELRDAGVEARWISAVTGQGLEDLVEELGRTLAAADEAERRAAP